MTTNQFYAGLALAQAMPGPLFNFAAYLGAVIAQNAGVNAVIGEGMLPVLPARVCARVPRLHSPAPLQPAKQSTRRTIMLLTLIPLLLLPWPALPCPAGVILCWVGLFAPGIIIIFGILPFWGTFRWAAGWDSGCWGEWVGWGCLETVLTPG
jgi:hypothetical protein